MRQTENIKLAKSQTLLYRPFAIDQIRDNAAGLNYTQGVDFNLDPVTGELVWTGPETVIGTDVQVIYQRA
jgi:hypothetical protein